MPPPYPNGWYPIALSGEVFKGKTKQVNALGRSFAVFRGEDNKARVLDAYCRHMGANLAQGGVVKGNCLQCPFHGWTYDGDTGDCVEIPYAEDPKKVRALGVVRATRTNATVDSTPGTNDAL